MNTARTPQEAGFQMPAEWQLHESVWLAWPSAADLWLETLPLAQAEFVAFCEAIVDLDRVTGTARGERLKILVCSSASESAARLQLGHLPATFHRVPFGDIWLRDTAPLFLQNKVGDLATLSFRFNGWGDKYAFPADKEVAAKVSQIAGLPSYTSEWICEGGSLEFDGEGTCLTTRQCLLNPNRNPGMTQADVEDLLHNTLGIERTLWLGDGLLNDHTDGHIDTIARFVAPGHVVIHEAQSKADPNYEIYKTIENDLEVMRDARGRKLRITRVPSPGSVLSAEQTVMPASYLNFYIANTTVVVPIYGEPNDAAAVFALAECFPTRRTIGLSARAILSGGGAFHCISQQQPRAARSRL